MKDFALVFRQPNYDYSKFTPEDFEALNVKWQNWMGNIAAQGKLVNNGTRLSPEGKVLKSGGVITDGPFVEIREMLGGIVVIRANDLDEATTLAHGCPAVDNGGSVEIRPIYTGA
ncbi:YciI family protein [Mucilaginibacter agri]|uniref:Transcription initiation protein n=1 Tax=Mucilaginibacter agri TaxID=2695265 RepID=A0A966DSE9_9SPHI|nr:YciI family protein [Mucilaginibacter agri]NCD69535.1 transcription initiation protein [Mucilaginibacter agri]